MELLYCHISREWLKLDKKRREKERKNNTKKKESPHCEVRKGGKMTNAIKGLVSKKKKRYKDGEFNLDLSCKLNSIVQCIERRHSCVGC